MNSPSEEVKVLVVGTSLAGLCAAKAAAQSGATTLLIDAAPEIGARANPATILVEPIWRRVGLPVPEDAVERELSGLRVGGPSGEGPLFRFRALHLDRRVFDRKFASMAAKAGATIRSGVRVTSMLPSGGVRTETAAVGAGITIFADGANSLVRGIMPTTLNPQELAFGLDQLLEAPGLGKPSLFEVRFGSFAPGWRAQLNPIGGDHARLWTFVRGVQQEELGNYAERAYRAFFPEERVRVLEERRGADPALVVPGRLTRDGVMACGAAAGQGGLEFGARAGVMAGETAARAVRAGDTSRRALKSYERAWHRETALQSRALRWGMEALRRLSDSELDGLFRGLSGVEFGEEDLLALLRGHPGNAVLRVGAKRTTKLFLGVARGWIRALIIR
ncbi:MAG: FAD-dependent oxidoreductase [Actinomycetota bacterium]|nr:FAD-dependent oxidoreductase [Actinomycetota bacterium]